LNELGKPWGRGFETRVYRGGLPRPSEVECEVERGVIPCGVASAGQNGSCGWDAEVLKDFAYRDGVGEDGDEVEASVAAGTFQRVDIVYAFEKRCPFEVG